MSPGLSPFFQPKGIAIVGARHSPGFGYALPLTLMKRGFGDILHLVNPSGGELHGKKLHRSVLEVPDPVDLAVVIVPASAVPDVLEEIGRRGIRHAVIESAGFAETGDGGRELQARAKKAAAEHGVRVIGPNCLGTVNTANRFSTVEVMDEALTPGPLAIIAQSGVFGNVLLDHLHQRGLFLSKAVTLGNRMDVNECEVLEYLHKDPCTKTVMAYLESAADGRRLVETLSRVTPDKPVLMLKSGRTGAGRLATASHTGSLSGEDKLYQAAFTQGGAVRADSLEELLDLAKVFTSQPLPRGGRLAIVTSSGSLGALATDTAVNLGLVLPDLSEATIEKARDGAPGWMNARNPLDVGPSMQFGKAFSAVLADPNVDMVILITIIPYAVMEQFRPFGLNAGTWFGDLALIRKEAPDKPVVVCAVGHSEFIKEMEELSGRDTPVFTSPEPAATALAKLYRYARRREG